MKLQKYLNESFTINNLMDHIPPAWVSKRGLKAGEKNKIGRDLQKLLKPTYFKQIPLDKMFKVLEKHGIVALQEDNTEWSGFLVGGVKNTEQVNFNLGWKNEVVEERGMKRYMAVPNAVLSMSYYKMPESGNYEVIGYVS